MKETMYLIKPSILHMHMCLSFPWDILQTLVLIYFAVDCCNPNKGLIFPLLIRQDTNYPVHWNPPMRHIYRHPQLTRQLPFSIPCISGYSLLQLQTIQRRWDGATEGAQAEEEENGEAASAAASFLPSLLGRRCKQPYEIERWCTLV